MKEITTTIYECEYCKKYYKRKHHAVIHEKTCKKNPDNLHPCKHCKYFGLEEVLIVGKTSNSLILEKGDISENAFYCYAKKVALHTNKREVRNIYYKYDGVENMPMPKVGECDRFEVMSNSVDEYKSLEMYTEYLKDIKEKQI